MNHFYIIQEHDILKNIEFFVPDRLKRIIREFKLRVELYGIPTPPGGGPSVDQEVIRHRHHPEVV